MARGGARAGAGRKAKTTEALMIVRKAAILNASERAGDLIPQIDPAIAALEPLDIMVIATQLAAEKGDWMVAAALAEKTAPYFHARRASIEVVHEHRTSPREYSMEELEAELATLVEDDHPKQDGDQPRSG